MLVFVFFFFKEENGIRGRVMCRGFRRLVFRSRKKKSGGTLIWDLYQYCLKKKKKKKKSDRKRVGEGKRVRPGVDRGGRRQLKTKKQHNL